MEAEGKIREFPKRESQKLQGWIDTLDFEQVGERFEEFARRKPVALALAALGIGFAAGMLLQRLPSSTVEKP